MSPLVLFSARPPSSTFFSSRGRPARAHFPSPDFPVSPAWHRFNMQGANSRQYKREMASFEVGSEKASTMAGSVLRDERARSEGDRDEGDRRWASRGGWRSSERRKRSEACHVRNGDDSFVCRAISFISHESNSIARVLGDRASASSLQQNVIGYAVNY